MQHIDVFNGDADGICALHQLRLDSPCPDARLITGVKRDITLLDQTRDVQNSVITVLDISLDRNRDALVKLLENRNNVFYADHHFSGAIPHAMNLEAHIDPSPRTCTSIIIDSLLNGKYRRWAVVGAFGDNLNETAADLGEKLGLTGHDLDILKETGVLLNYNGYGATLEDLFYHPAELYRQVQPYENPFDFFADSPALNGVSL